MSESTSEWYEREAQGLRDRIATVAQAAGIGVVDVSGVATELCTNHGMSTHFHAVVSDADLLAKLGKIERTRPALFKRDESNMPGMPGQMHAYARLCWGASVEEKWQALTAVQRLDMIRRWEDSRTMKTDAARMLDAMKARHGEDWQSKISATERSQLLDVGVGLPSDKARKPFNEDQRLIWIRQEANLRAQASRLRFKSGSSSDAMHAAEQRSVMLQEADALALKIRGSKVAA